MARHQSNAIASLIIFTKPPALDDTAENLDVRDYQGALLLLE